MVVPFRAVIRLAGRPMVARCVVREAATSSTTRGFRLGRPMRPTLASAPPSRWLSTTAPRRLVPSPLAAAAAAPRARWVAVGSRTLLQRHYVGRGALVARDVVLKRSIVASPAEKRALSSGGASRSVLSRLIGLGGFAALAFGKLKYLLIALKLTKFAPVISMVISSGAYSMVYGPAYGCGMVGLICVHECGHAAAMRAYGMPFSPMVFIPFLGAMIQMRDSPRNPFESSVIALAGPYVGGAGAAAVAVAGHALDSQLLMALGDWGFMINLFNLLPIGGLDGGHVADALHPALPALGLAGGAGLVYAGAISNPIFYLILLGGAFQVGGRLFGFSEPTPAAKRLQGLGMAGVASAYAAIVAALITAMALNNVGRKSAKRILAESRGEVIDLPPTGAVEGPYDNYFAEFTGTDPDADDDEW